MARITRRAFGKVAAVAGVVAATGMVRGQTNSETTTKGSPANRVRLGFIGVGNRGDQVLSGFLTQKDAEVVGICDLHPKYLDFAEKKIGGKVDRYSDYRKLLDRKDVDAVVIATPDHWHALQ